MYLPISILAFILNGISVIISKFLLVKVIPDPIIYIFYISLLSLLGLFALPLTNIPTNEAIILASLSSLLWTFAAYFMFKALKVGQISRVIPIIGTLNPLILFVIELSSSSLIIPEIWAIILLILGIIFLTLPDWKGKMNKSELYFEITSSALFAFSYLILKQAYLQADFITVLVWSRFVLIPFIIAFFFIPSLRVKILPKPKPNGFSGKGSLLFALGQASGAASQILIFFAISLANPALVNSLQGTQYVFLFVAALLLSKKFPTVFAEKYPKAVIIFKILGILLIGLGLYLLA